MNAGFVRFLLGVAWLVAVLQLTASAQTAASVQAAHAAATAVKVTVAEQRNLEVWEPSVGQLEPKVAPLIAAEVAGRLIDVKVDVGDHVAAGQLLAVIDATDLRLTRDMTVADIARLKALIRAERLTVKRYVTLVKTQSVDQSSLDDAQAQLGALRAELVAARVHLSQAQRDLDKTKITSPLDGRVDSSQVSRGDYVKIGSPLMRITTVRWLKARLPYPETLLSQLRPGLPVRLESVSVPGVTLQTVVSEVRPSITFGSRSAQVIVTIENPGSFEPGATVNGAVRVAQHEHAVTLPEISVVRRPAGTVVYVIKGGKAVQRLVSTGLRSQGRVEILTGVAAGERVISDGAGFLSDGAPVVVASGVRAP